MAEILSTKGQLEEFKDSMIWWDIKNELEQLAYVALLEYDLVGEPQVDNDEKVHPSTAETLIHLGDIKGRRKAVVNFLSIIDVLISLAEEQNEP